MKTLVTGASGFVGSAIVCQLLDAGHNVRARLRSSSTRDNIVQTLEELILPLYYGERGRHPFC